MHHAEALNLFLTPKEITEKACSDTPINVLSTLGQLISLSCHKSSAEMKTIAWNYAGILYQQVALSAFAKFIDSVFFNW